MDAKVGVSCPVQRTSHYVYDILSETFIQRGSDPRTKVYMEMAAA